MLDQIMEYQKGKSLGCQDIGIKKIEFVGKTQFLCFKSTA